MIAFVAILALSDNAAPIVTSPSYIAANHSLPSFIEENITVDCEVYYIVEAYGGFDPYAQRGSPVWNMQNGPLNVITRAKQIC
jgi:hypothetical protein